MDKKSNLETPEMFACKKINPEFCKTCIFRHGKPPFADLPTKAYCMIYSEESGNKKPDAVYFNGARCEYYSNEEEKDTE